MTEKNYTREDIDKACMQAANRFNQFEFQVPDAPGEEKGRKMAYNLYVPKNILWFCLSMIWEAAQRM